MPENLPSNPSSSSPSVSANQLASSGGTWRNLAVVVAAIILGISVFLGFQSQNPSATLSSLAAEAVPLEQALANPQPTLMEFYANWCTTCQAMASDLGKLKTDYDGQVNFVMLNVDNSKWLPEMLRYRVDGIPHFVYLSEDGEAVATAIGEQPRPIMAENLNALIAHQPLPHQQGLGQTSGLDTPLSRQQVMNDDPRSHGGQVVQ